MNFRFPAKRPDAYPVYLLYAGVMSFGFALFNTLNMVYQIQMAGLTPLQLVLLGTTLEVTILLAEVPTGIVADVYSRRLSVIIGTMLLGLGFIVEAAVPRFEVIFVAQVVMGVGFTFLSGAEQAWIADEVGESRVGHVFVRGGQVGRLVGLAGIVFSVALGSIALQLPLVVGGITLLLLGLALIFMMPETGFKPTPRGERSSFQAMRGTFVDGLKLVRGSRVLLTVLAVGLFIGLYSEGVDRLWEKHLLQNFTLPGLGQLDTVVWWGILSVVGTFASIGLAELVRRRVNMDADASLLRGQMLVIGLIIGALLAFALAQNVWLAMAAILLVGAARSTLSPLFMAWMSRNTRPEVRATVFSFAGQIDAVGQIGGGPALGGLATLAGLRATFVACALLISPALLLLARARPAAVEDADADPAPEAAD